MLIYNKILVLLVGLIAFILAATVEDTVYGLVSYAWSGISSSFGPVLLLLLFWKKLSRAGVYAGFITGTISTIIWKTWIADLTGISERLASYLLAFGMAVLFSLVWRENKR